MTNKGNFVIRSYGLFLNEKKQVLVTDEFQAGMKMTKFPGGGLHFGEGLIDCLKREIKEECNGQKITNIHHFYTTDFYQKALFYENHQLISVYYLAEMTEPLEFKVSTRPFDFEKMKNGSQSFRWVNLNQLKEDEFSFPIDKFVCSKLVKHFK